MIRHRSAKKKYEHPDYLKHLETIKTFIEEVNSFASTGSATILRHFGGLSDHELSNHELSYRKLSNRKLSTSRPPTPYTGKWGMREWGNGGIR